MAERSAKMARTKYIYYQPNDLDTKDERGDCTIRAFCKALNKTWIEVFDDLYQYARKAQCLPNQKWAYEEYLSSIGWNYIPIKRGQKLMVEDFVKANKAGNYILYVRVGYRTHLVAAVDGNYFDTWDCGKKYLYGYYKKE